jgi:hypothetical protein
MIILGHLQGLIKPYYKNGVRSIVAENMTLQAVAFDRQAQYLLHRATADSAYASLLVPQAAKDLYKAVIQKFEIAHSLLFNYNISLNRLEKREQFTEVATRLLAEGKIGRRPKNLRPDLKISKDKAEQLRRDGKVVEEWFIRTDEEEEIVVQMKRDWEEKYGKLKQNM